MHDDWTSLVRSGQKLVTSLGDAKWALGDLALTVELKYGEHSLAKFADEVGVSYESLRDYRRVAAAFEKAERSTIWAAHRVLAGDEYRHLVKPGMTYRQAKAARKQAEKAHKPNPGVLAITMTEIPVEAADAAPKSEKKTTAKEEAAQWGDGEVEIIESEAREILDNESFDSFRDELPEKEHRKTEAHARAREAITALGMSYVLIEHYDEEYVGILGVAQAQDLLRACRETAAALDYAINLYTKPAQLMEDAVAA